MGQTESDFNIGEVIDALGIQLPTRVDEIPAAKEEPAQAEPEADQETVAEDNTDNETTEEQESTDEPADEADESEETEETEETDEEESDDEAEAQAAEPAAVKKLHKRVDKLTARAKSAEEQAATLQAELAATKDELTRAQPIVVQDAADPLADVQSVNELEGRLAAANTVLDNVPDLIAKADMEGGEIDVPMGDGSTRRFSKAELQERLRTARAILKAEPQRRNYFAARETFQQEAKQVYPELFQNESPARKMMLETLKAYPGIAKLPNLELIIGDAIRGQAIRFQQAEAVQKKAATAKAKPAAPTAKPAMAPKVVSPSAAPKTKAKANPLEALKKSGNRDAAEAFVASLFN